MSWVRRLLLLAGLVFGAWLLGSVSSAATAHADIRVDVELPLVEVSVVLDTTPAHPAEPPVEQPLPSQPRTETPPLVATPPPAAPVAVPAPVVEAAPVVPPAADPAPLAVVESPAPPPHEPQQVDHPLPGSTPPPSGAGQSGAGTPLVGTLTFTVHSAGGAVALVPAGDQDVPSLLHVEDPSFSPD